MKTLNVLLNEELNKTKFKLSDAIRKLKTMEQNAVLPFDSVDGYPETVESFKTNLEEIMDMNGDIPITDIEGDEAITYLTQLLSVHKHK